MSRRFFTNIHKTRNFACECPDRIGMDENFSVGPYPISPYLKSKIITV